MAAIAADHSGAVMQPVAERDMAVEAAQSAAPVEAALREPAAEPAALPKTSSLQHAAAVMPSPEATAPRSPTQDPDASEAADGEDVRGGPGSTDAEDGGDVTEESAEDIRACLFSLLQRKCPELRITCNALGMLEGLLDQVRQGPAHGIHIDAREPSFMRSHELLVISSLWNIAVSCTQSVNRNVCLAADFAEGASGGAAATRGCFWRRPRAPHQPRHPEGSLHELDLLFGTATTIELMLPGVILVACDMRSLLRCHGELQQRVGWPQAVKQLLPNEQLPAAALKNSWHLDKQSLRGIKRRRALHEAEGQEAPGGATAASGSRP